MKKWQQYLNFNLDITYLIFNIIVLFIVLIFSYKLYHYGYDLYLILPKFPHNLLEAKVLLSSYNKLDLLKIIWYSILMCGSYLLSIILLYSSFEGIWQIIKKATVIKF